MNVFFLHRHPQMCAMHHCDKHVVKMILEYAQLLSTAHHMLSPYPMDELYKLTHKNHPSAKWVRKSGEHYKWTFELFRNLCKEYTHRYGKVHKTEKLIPYLCSLPINIALYEKWSDPPLAMDDDCKMGDAILSYRTYYKYKKSHLLCYTNRDLPEWLK